MRRPVLFLLVPFIIGHLAFISISWSIVLLIIYSVCLLSKENLLKATLMGLMGLALGYGLTLYTYEARLVIDESWQTMTTFEGIFYEASPLDEASGCLVIESEAPQINNRRIKLYWPKTYEGQLPHTGRRIKLSGQFQAPAFARNRYRFNERLYMASQGYSGTVFVKDFALLDGEVAVEVLRGKLLKSSVEKLLSFTAFDQGEIAVGMLLGVDERIDEATQEAFKKTGLMHLLSISGAHFAVLFYYLNILTSRISGSYGMRKTTQYSCILSFVWLIGFPMAALRALLMYFILECMRQRRRQPDGLNALCLCMMLLLLVNPFAIWDIGLQLAALAMLAIFSFVPLCHKLLGLEALKKAIRLNADQSFYSPLSRWLLARLEEVYTGFLVSLVMMPLLTYYFYQVQWVGVLFGPLLTLLATAFLPLGALMLVAPFDFIATALGSLSGLLLKVMADLSMLLSQVIHNPLMASGGGLTLGLLIVSLGLIIAYKQRSELFIDHKSPMVVIGICVSLLIVAVELPQFCSPLVLKSLISRQTQVIALDVGQGDSTLIISPEGKTLLIDAGLAKGRLMAYESLLSLGIKQIDLLVLSHPHDDHYGGISKLAQNLRIKAFMYYGGPYSKDSEVVLNQLITSLKAGGTQVFTASQGDQLSIDQSDQFTVLWPPKGYENKDENDLSLVLLYQTENLQLLLTGDISSQVEYDIMKRVPQKATLLKLAHHGSRYSNSETLLAHPGLVMAYGQAGWANRYKHPHEETLKRLEAEELLYLSTHESGAIAMSISNKQIKYTYERLRTKGRWR